MLIILNKSILPLLTLFKLLLTMLLPNNSFILQKSMFELFDLYSWLWLEEEISFYENLGELGINLPFKKYFVKLSNVEGNNEE